MKNDTIYLENSIQSFKDMESAFWDNKGNKVNPHNVKEKLIENIKNLPEVYPSEFRYLYRLYRLTEFRLLNKKDIGY